MITTLTAHSTAHRNGLPQAWSPAGRTLPTMFYVWPGAVGWHLRGEDLEPLIFPSGAAAEHQARLVAKRLARFGLDVRVNVYDQSNVLAGVITYFGCDGATAPESGGRV